MASSSKKKSSKKKTSKLSSKTKRMKKIPKNASKKTRRHDSSSEDLVREQSVSLPSDSNSDNDSMSSLSSSEGAYRSKKKGSRLKKKDKSKASRRSPSSEDLTSGRKRKRLRKRKGQSESKKKSLKKKPRRHARISSPGSDSSSCSTCNSNSTSEETDFPRHKTKFKKNKKRRIESKTETVLNKERTDNSPEGSSDCSSRDQNYIVSHGEEKFAGENISRRLKSVITVVVRPYEEEENTSEKDILKEKAVCDLRDFPSYKSVDTTGTRSTRDSPPHSPAASDCKRRMEDFCGGGSSLSSQRESEPSDCRKADIAKDVRYPLQDELKNESEKDTCDHILPDDGPGGNDLESILRRKALENLKKFRVKADVKKIGNESKIGDANVNQLSTSKKVVVERRLPELGISDVNTNVNGIKPDDAYTSQLPTGKDVVAGRRLAELGSTNVKTNGGEVKKDDVSTNQLSTAKEKVLGRRLAHLGSSNVTGRAIINERVKPLFNRDGPRPALSGQEISDGRFIDKKSEAGNVNTVDPLDKSTHFVNPIKEHASSQSFATRSVSSNLLRKGKHSGMQSTANLKSTSVSSDKELTVNKVSETDTMDETNHSTSPITNDDHQRKAREVTPPSSATEELASSVQCGAPQGQSSNDQKNETKGVSDFKEKKMTVMRGGEMVEVSYKVYIPQRSPALARRQLNR